MPTEHKFFRTVSLKRLYPTNYKMRQTEVSKRILSGAKPKGEKKLIKVIQSLGEFSEKVRQASQMRF